ncbi:MAG: hypothetical protein M0R77_19460 [Gammaproteobacteria bacterium]|nr:hypothetical protein [Gammaproteobacteria bacterium]
MQKEMRVVSFANAYMGYKQAHELKDDVVGNMVDFKNWMLENGLKIDEKDMLQSMFVVGKITENEERKMEKSELKERQDGAFERDGKIFVKIGNELYEESLLLKLIEKNEKQFKGFKNPKTQERLWLIGVVVVLIMLVFSSNLHGYNTHEERIKSEDIIIQNARKSAREVVIPPEPLSCEGKKIKWTKAKYYRFKGDFTDYFVSLYSGFYTQSQKDWFTQNTALIDDKRVLCVNKKRVKNAKSKHTN